ncbi:DUF6504 family protein [Alicyclobacillus macrosporangiidus]|uniref:DUF6504 family protein n=1 Tax=Alicyclobacillus macrosporangiidus TaxID=392015 RepID=UPI003CCC175B
MSRLLRRSIEILEFASDEFTPRVFRDRGVIRVIADLIDRWAESGDWLNGDRDRWVFRVLTEDMGVFDLKFDSTLVRTRVCGCKFALHQHPHRLMGMALHRLKSVQLSSEFSFSGDGVPSGLDAFFLATRFSFVTSIILLGFGMFNRPITSATMAGAGGTIRNVFSRNTTGCPVSMRTASGLGVAPESAD